MNPSRLLAPLAAPALLLALLLPSLARAHAGALIAAFVGHLWLAQS